MKTAQQVIAETLCRQAETDGFLSYDWRYYTIQADAVAADLASEGYSIVRIEVLRQVLPPFTNPDKPITSEGNQ